MKNRQGIIGKILAAQSKEYLLVNCTDEILTLFNALLVYIYTVDMPRSELHSFSLAGSRINETRVPINNRSIAGFVANTGRGVNIKNASDREELRNVDETLFHDSAGDMFTGYRFAQMLAEPILHEGMLVGVIQIVNRRDGQTFTADAQRLLGVIAEALGIAFHNFKLDATKQEAHPVHLSRDNSDKEMGTKRARTEPHPHKETIEELRRRFEDTQDVRGIFVEHTEVIAALLNAKLVTIYAVDKPRNEIYTLYIRGSQIREDRQPINNRSIAGFVANTGRVVSVADAYDQDELKSIDRTLFHDEAWDKHWGYRAAQMLVLPISRESTLMGVIQIVNRKGGGRFTEKERKRLEEIAGAIGIALSNHHRASSQRKTRFDYLAARNLLTFSALDSAFTESRRTGEPIEELLMKRYRISRDDIGRSLEDYYGCRYVHYRPTYPIPDNLLKNLKRDYLRREFWVPLEKGADGRIRVIVEDPDNFLKRDIIENILHTKSIEYCVSLKTDVIKFINYFYGRLSEEDYTTHIKHFPQEPFAPACTANEPQTSDTLAGRLRALKVRPKPVLLQRIDAMCYSMGLDDGTPLQREYTCPTCGEKTLYAPKAPVAGTPAQVKDKRPPWEAHLAQPYFRLEDIEECRRAVRQIQGITVELDESQFCRRCRPNCEDPVLLLKVHYGNVCKITPDIRYFDLVLLSDFMQGKLQTSGGYAALVDHMKRLEELLGVKMDG